MTKDELKQSVERNLRFAREFFDMNGDDGLAPMFIVESTRGGRVGAMVAIAPGELALENKFDRLFDLGVLASLQRFRGDVDTVNAIFMMSEAWISIADKKDGTEVKATDFIQPSQDPKRREGLISAAMSRDGNTAFDMFEIKRSIDLDNGRIIVNFLPFEEEVAPKEAIKADSPLLESFWKGVEMMDTFVTTLPAELEKYVKEMPVEEMFLKLVKQLEEFRKH
jgi:hypothetical protein